jgi:hypothetical protein
MCIAALAASVGRGSLAWVSECVIPWSEPPLWLPAAA